MWPFDCQYMNEMMMIPHAATAMYGAATMAADLAYLSFAALVSAESRDNDTLFEMFVVWV